MNRFFAFFVVSLLIHAVVGAILISRSGLLGGKGKEEAVEVKPVEESEEPTVEPIEEPVVKPKKIKKPLKPKVKKKKAAPKKNKKPAPVVKEVKPEKPVETPPPQTEPVDKKPEAQKEEPVDESELIEPKKEEAPPVEEPTESPKEEDESELIEPEKEEVKPEEKKEEPPKPSGSDVKKPSAIEIKQARSHSQLKQIKGNPMPVYPAEALEKKWEGRVEVIYYVNPGGFVEQIQLKKSSGHSALDNSALRALSRYRYHPGQEGWVQHPVEFFLEKGKEVKEVAPLGVPESK